MTDLKEGRAAWVKEPRYRRIRLTPRHDGVRTDRGLSFIQDAYHVSDRVLRADIESMTDGDVTIDFDYQLATDEVVLFEWAVPRPYMLPPPAPAPSCGRIIGAPTPADRLANICIAVVVAAAIAVMCCVVAWGLLR